MNRNTIITFCQDYLKVKDFTDACVNGLQVEGAEEISQVITGVSLSQALIQAAIAKKAQMIVVHHGLFAKSLGEPPLIKGYVRGRLKMVLSNNINLAGWHLPLDAHPLIGNNISLCKLLGIIKIKPIDVGFIGELKIALPLDDFVKMVNLKLSTKSYVISGGKKQVKRVGVISGGASPDFVLAAALGADTFVCGDVRESVVEAVKESGINFINAGHYNTEKLGIINLGKLITKKFGIHNEFVDVPCDI